MSQDIEQYRAGFEAWARDKWPGLPLDGEHIKGGIWVYYDDIARDWWQVWTAAKREASTEPSAAYAQQLRAAVETVCEGWTLPHDARKVLETALWADSGASTEQQKDEATDAALSGASCAMCGAAVWNTPAGPVVMSKKELADDGYCKGCSCRADCEPCAWAKRETAAIAHTKAQEGK